MIDTLARDFGFLTMPLADRLSLDDSFLQRGDVGFQGLERTAFVRVVNGLGVGATQAVFLGVPYMRGICPLKRIEFFLAS